MYKKYNLQCTIYKKAIAIALQMKIYRQLIKNWKDKIFLHCPVTTCIPASQCKARLSYFHFAIVTVMFCPVLVLNWLCV